MGKYIEEAKEMYEEAKKEFEEGCKENNRIKMHDASEKAWISVVLATNEQFAKRNVPIPKSHRERRNRLRELEKRDELIREKGLVDRFSARDHHLHEQCFYEGYCEPDLLEENIEKVKRYIEDIEEL